MALTAEQRTTLASRLSEREHQLKQEIESVSSEIKEELQLEREVGDGAARYALKEEASIDRAEILRDVQELKDVQTARARLAEGGYGECVSCGVDIPTERLLAQPAALRCTACQASLERK